MVPQALPKISPKSTQIVIESPLTDADSFELAMTLPLPSLIEPETFAVTPFFVLTVNLDLAEISATLVRSPAIIIYNGIFTEEEPVNVRSLRVASPFNLILAKPAK